MKLHDHKRISIQGRTVEVTVGLRYHVVVRSRDYSDAEYDATLKTIQTLDPNPYPDPFDPRPPLFPTYDFLHFESAVGTTGNRPLVGAIGARDFTIASIVPIS